MRRVVAILNSVAGNNKREVSSAMQVVTPRQRLSGKRSWSGNNRDWLVKPEGAMVWIY
jgi:hypothetical protein